MSQNSETLEEAPLISHLTELRQRLIYSFVFFGLCVGGCFYFADTLFIFLLKPLKYALGEDLKVTYWAPHEAFFAYMNLALYAGLIISLPFFLIQIWRFIAPGLYNNEKKAFLPFLLMTPVMFSVGLSFAFYIVLPAALSFFAGFQSAADMGGTEIIQETRVSEYLQFCLSFLLIFGLAFELPIGLVLAGKAGLISADTLRKTRPYALMGIAISSAFFTPPDIISMFSLAAPLYIMYEISILLIASFKNNHHKGENSA